MVLDNKSQIGEFGSRHDWARLELAAVRLANARELSDWRALVKAFPDLMPRGMGGVNWKAAFREQDATASAALKAAARVQLKLRAAWQTPEGMLRQLLLTECAGDYIGRVLGSGLGGYITTVGKWENYNFPLLPRHVRRVREIEAALRQNQFMFVLAAALRAAPKMRVCQNLECPHPFYLRSEGGKQFCSKACAAPSQRAHKLQWWNRHKKELLARRRAEYRKRSKRASGRIKSQRREKRK